MEIVGTRNSKDIVRKRNYYSMLLMSVRSVKKDISDFAEQVKNYTKEYNELKRKYAMLTFKQRQEKKEGR